jgi:hypothetical protein
VDNRTRARARPTIQEPDIYSRRLLRLAVAAAILAAGIAFAAPASASVTYDPETKTGTVAESDVRSAFGWTGATLAAKASGLVFDHDFWTDDTYSVACGDHVFPMVHRSEFGRFELADSLTHDGRRGTSGYAGATLTGFRLTGPRLGISGTTVPPMAGQPCPADQAPSPGSTIDTATLVSTATGWALAVSSGDVRHELLTGGSPNR